MSRRHAICRRCGGLHSEKFACKKRRAAALVGTVVRDKYEITQVIGTGGNGTVYEAVDRVFRRMVALKVPASEPTQNRTTLERFSREARAVAAIAHPNVAVIYDSGTLPDGAPFLVMERLTGETLAARLKRGKLPLAEALGITIQVLAGLAAAHAKRIVHRDIKPANVFLTSQEGYRTLPKILDFGVSKFLDEEWEETTELTAPGIILGTPAYMPPEQISGQATLDERADIFSVGTVLYEAVTGQRAFPAARPDDAMDQVMTRRPPAPSLIVPSLPPELDMAIQRAMARRPERRHPSASAFSVALQTLRSAPSAARVQPALDPSDKLERLREQFRTVAERHRSGGPDVQSRPSIKAAVPYAGKLASLVEEDDSETDLHTPDSRSFS